MAQSITSVLDKLEILARDVIGTDVLYLIHGTGSDRDKFIKVSELKKLVSTIEHLTVTDIMFVSGETSAAVELDSDGNILFLSGVHSEGKVVSDLGFEGNLEGNLEGNVTGNTTGVHEGDVHTTNIAPITSDQTTPAVRIGSALGGVELVGETKNFNGDVNTNKIKPHNPYAPVMIGGETKGSEFKGPTVFDNAVALAVVDVVLNGSEVIANVNPSPSVDLTGKSMIRITDQNVSGKYWDITKIPGGIIGQKITVVNDVAGQSVNIYYGRTGYYAVIPPRSACEFLLTGVSPTQTVDNHWCVLAGSTIEIVPQQ